MNQQSTLESEQSEKSHQQTSKSSIGTTIMVWGVIYILFVIVPVTILSITDSDFRPESLGVVTVLFLLLIGLGFLGVRKDKKRSNSWRDLAQSNGYVYHQEADIMPRLKGSLFVDDRMEMDNVDAVEAKHQGYTCLLGVGDWSARDVSAYRRLVKRLSFMVITLPRAYPRVAVDSRGVVGSITRVEDMRSASLVQPPADMAKDMTIRCAVGFEGTLSSLISADLLRYLKSFAAPFSLEIRDSELYIYLYKEIQPSFDSVNQLLKVTGFITTPQVEEKVNAQDTPLVATASSTKVKIPLTLAFFPLWLRVTVGVVLALMISPYLLGAIKIFFVSIFG